VIYLDDMTIFSKTQDDHLTQLQKIFKKCRKYGLSLNPKKSFFAMTEGKLQGNIIYKEGVKINPKRVEYIQTISFPRINNKYNHP